jgi:hypothetical protein
VSELEARLSELAVEWPEAPDVTARVRARLEEARPRRRRWPRIAIPVAVLALVAAVPPARSTVLDWLGLDGVKIERVPKAPTPAPSITPLDLGKRVPLATATLVPGELGPPDAVFRADDVVTLFYRPRGGLPESENTGAGALITQLPGHTNEIYIHKLAGPNTKIERVTIDGEPGFWLAGASHGVLYEHPSGAVREAPARLAGNTLLWERGGLTLRLEADITKERALAIARSVE